MRTIKAEIDPGQDIATAFGEAMRIANKLKCDIEFNFNGVICIARQGGNVKKGIDEYFRLLQSDTTHKTAIA